MTNTELDRFKYECARDYLDGVRSSSIKADCLRSNIEELERRMVDIKGVDYSSGPSSAGSATDGQELLTAMIDRLDIMRGTLAARLEELDGRITEATSAALALESGTESAVLIDYYISRVGTWSDVARLRGYSYDGIMCVRSRAIRNYYDVMPLCERQEIPPAL